MNEIINRNDFNKCVETALIKDTFFDYGVVNAYMRANSNDFGMWLYMSPKGIGKSQSSMQYIYDNYLNKDFVNDYKFAWFRTKDESARMLRYAFLQNTPYIDLCNEKGKVIKKPMFKTDGRGWISRYFPDGRCQIVGLIAAISVWDNYKSSGITGFKDIIYDEFNQTDSLSIRQQQNFWMNITSLFSTLARENIYGTDRCIFSILGNQDSDNNYILNNLERIGYDNDKAIDYLNAFPSNHYTWIDKSTKIGLSIAGFKAYGKVSSRNSDNIVNILASGNIQTKNFFMGNNFGIREGKFIKPLCKFDWVEIFIRVAIGTFDQLQKNICFCSCGIGKNQGYLWVYEDDLIEVGFGKKVKEFPILAITTLSMYSNINVELGEQSYLSLVKDVKDIYQSNDIYYSSYDLKGLIERWLSRGIVNI